MARRNMKRTLRVAVSDAEKQHMGMIKMQRCCGCGKPGPNEAHHCRSDSFGGKRASGYATISLCPDCHRLGVNAFHRNKGGWEAEHGPDWSFIPVMLELLGIDINVDF